MQDLQGQAAKSSDSSISLGLSACVLSFCLLLQPGWSREAAQAADNAHACTAYRLEMVMSLGERLTSNLWSSALMSSSSAACSCLSEGHQGT